jgi:cytoplasmic iron level regulating protein YaaA (DUF328/UPF0246 family)
MLLILPPSDTQHPSPDHGRPVDLGSLSFPELTPMRVRILDALVETSARADAFERLLVRPSMAEAVARNTALPDLPALPVLEVYSGPLHQGLDASTFSAVARDRAGRSLVVTSALWGALRPRDRIPPYRLDVCARLVGLDRLEPTWRTVLPDALAVAAGTSGIVVDLRSPSYQAIGLPTGLGDRTISLHVEQHAAGGRRIGDVIAKRVRGMAARHLLESDAEPETVDDVADLLADRWPVQPRPPARRGQPTRLSLTADG